MKRSYGAWIIIGVLYLLSIPQMLWGATLQITWNANTEQDLSGYRLYYSTSSGSYNYVLNLGNVTTATIDGFLDGCTYYVALTAYDYSGNESGFSDEVSVSIPATQEGGGIVSRIYDWLVSLFSGGQNDDPELAQYNIQDFSSVSKQAVLEALSVVRVGDLSDSGTPSVVDPGTSEEYIVRDAIAMVGGYFDFSTLYPDGTYLFLPLTQDSPLVENNFFSSTSPGIYLYLVADSLGEYLHILRVSAVDLLYVTADFEYGTETYLEDPYFGISVLLPSGAIEGDAPVAIGQNYSDITEANAQLWRNTIEFTIAPYGLALAEPAEIRVAMDTTSAGAEYYDENVKEWKVIPDVKVENGAAVFSTQYLGRFKVYDTAEGSSPSGSGGGGGGGGGCFISSCR